MNSAASEPRDLEARRRAIDVHISAIVQAPAGSGKTELLTQRFLALLEIAEQPGEIVALTFTRKAAAEMQGRILRALAIATGDPLKPGEKILPATFELARKALARDHQQRWGLLQDPGQLRVQTIDALSLELALSSPLEAPAVSQVQDDAKESYSEAATALIRELGGDDDQLNAAMRNVLLHLDADVRLLRELLQGMLAHRDQWKRHIPVAENAAAFRAELEATLQRAIRRGLRALCSAFPQTVVAQLPALARFAIRNGNATERLAQVEQLRQLPGAELADLPRWRAIRDFLCVKSGKTLRKKVDKGDGFPAGSREREEMLAALRTCAAVPALEAAFRELEYLPPAQLDDQQWEVAQSLFRLLPRSIELLAEIFARRDVADFSFFAQSAGKIAHDRPEQAHIRHLLIDEYQDTSLTQHRFFEFLVSRWQAGDGRTLFLVGDPMQSIYRFRQAEVELFLEIFARRSFGPVRLEPLVLRSNFRSHTRLVEWVNDSFQKIFARTQSAPAAVAFTSSEAQRRDPGPEVRILADVQFKDEIDDSSEREAERACEIIAAERDCDSQARIAVLVRSREHLARIVPALRAREVPFVAVEIEKLGETQIVRDLMALARAILHPGDRIAWLAVLRAPWCGLELGDFEQLCGADPKSCIPQLIAQRRSLLSGEAQKRLRRVMPVLEAAFSERGCRPLARLVEGTWIALGGPACLQESDRPNAEAFFRLMHDTEMAGDIADWQLLTRRAADLFAQHSSAHPNPVQLMTIHKAKGLEFDVVLLPGLGKRTGGGEGQLLRWLERNTEDGRELLLAPVGAKGEDTDPLFRYLRHVDQQCEEQEARRVAYVAATRARESLYLLGCVTAKPARDGAVDPKPTGGSLLEIMWPALAPYFEREAAARVAQPQPARLALAAQSTPAATLLRLPADWRFPSAPAPVVFTEREPLSEPISYEWASDVRRHSGTVIHFMLQRIAGQGIAGWNAATVAASRELISRLLRYEGVPREQIAAAAQEVMHALDFAVSDQRGRWCLSPHAEAESELDLSGAVGAAPQRVRIDRTFVADGVRWIVDFKTGPHQGAGNERFLDEEVARYREQLEKYAALLRPLESRPIRVGIFFPLARGWREWEPQHKATVAGAG